MPTYQYSCTECEHFFEQFQTFSEDSLTDCPQCTGQLRKVYNAVGVVFKGSGFYRTDSRTDSRTAGAASADAGSSGSSSSSSSKDSGSGGAASTGSTSGSGSAGSASTNTTGSAA